MFSCFTTAETPLAILPRSSSSLRWRLCSQELVLYHLTNSGHISRKKASIQSLWALTPLLYDLPFINADVVRAAYTADSISRSPSPELRNFLPIIARKLKAIWNVPIPITTSKICLETSTVFVWPLHNSKVKCYHSIFLAPDITYGLSMLENSVYCTELC